MPLFSHSPSIKRGIACCLSVALAEGLIPALQCARLESGRDKSSQGETAIAKLVKRLRSGLERRFAFVKGRFLANTWGILTARTFHQLGHDDAGDMAASIAYYAFLSLFPLALGATAVLGFVLPSESVRREMFAFFDRNLPTSSGLLRENVTSVVNARGTLGVIGLMGLLWSGSAIFGSIGRAMNRAWGVQKRRPLYVTKLRDVLLSGGVGGVLLVSTGLAAATSALPAGLLPFGATTAVILGQTISALLIFAVISLMYKLMPNAMVAWREVWPGACLATALLVILRGAFSLYLAKFANYELVYGQVASIVALLVWIYASAYVLILGIELSSEYAKLRKQGRSSRF